MLAKLLTATTMAYETACAIRNSAKTQFEHCTKLIERKEFIQERLDKAGSSEPVLIDVESLRVKLQHFDRQLSAAATLDTRVQVVSSQADSARTALRKALDLQATFGRIEAVDGATITEAKGKVQALQELAKTRQGMLSQIGVLGGRIQETTDQLQRLKNQFVTEEKQTTWVQLCKRVRDVMHVSGLPTLLMREYAGVLNRRLAHYLTIWEAPFVMRLDERLAFQVDFMDGRSHGADRLSGGQKIVASTSFRLAMADTFAKQVGLLVLDEPSNYLDKDNITHLQGLLLRLKEHASSTGRQIILVTHEESLMGFFDHSITRYQ
jgi:DNA repair exonuclease SbcCD ATPase subunit